MSMATITLLSVDQAKPGFEFTYLGAAPACGPCRFRNACLSLDLGHRYVVSAVRAVKHPCAMQESEACVVEVEPVLRQLVVDANGAVPGATVEIGRYPCNRLDCPHWNDCAGPSLGGKSRFTIEEVREEKVCLAGRRIKLVRTK
jgi:hypothetical protein